MHRSANWTSSIPRRRFLSRSALATAGGLTALTLGCGDDDDNEPSTGTPATGQTTQPTQAGQTATTAPSSPTVTPKTGGRLRTILPADFLHLDFQVSTTANTIGMAGIFAQTLFRFSYDDATTAEIKGHLAKDFEQQDPQTLVLTLDERAKWHDIAPVSGRAVDAEDIKATLDRILNPATGSALIRQYGAFIDSVQATDKTHVAIKLKRPVIGIEKMFAGPNTPMMPKEGTAGVHDPKMVGIGSGPFIVTSAQPGAGVKFDRNPNYWKPGLPYVDGVDHVVVADVAQIFNALITGDVSVYQLTQTNLAALEARNPDANIVRYPTTAVRGIFMPARPDSPYGDIRVRQAVKYAVNQDEIIERVYGGGDNAQFSGIITPASAHLALPEAEARTIWGRDVARARQLLSDAGHSGGLKLPLMFSTQAGSQLMGDIVQVLAAQLSEVGIELEISDKDSITGNSLMLGKTKNYGAALWNRTAQIPDHIDWLYKGYSLDGLFNFTEDTESVDADLQKMIDDMLSEQDADERQEIIYEIQRHIGEIAIVAPTPAGYQYVASQQNVMNHAPHMSEIYGIAVRKYEEVWLA